MNEDKFSKSIDDDQLDEVAGGTFDESMTDLQFLMEVDAQYGTKYVENSMGSFNNGTAKKMNTTTCSPVKNLNPENQHFPLCRLYEPGIKMPTWRVLCRFKIFYGGKTQGKVYR